jgi:hypothetical protein
MKWLSLAALTLAVAGAARQRRAPRGFVRSVAVAATDLRRVRGHCALRRED